MLDNVEGGVGLCDIYTMLLNVNEFAIGIFLKFVYLFSQRISYIVTQYFVEDFIFIDGYRGENLLFDVLLKYFSIKRSNSRNRRK